MKAKIKKTGQVVEVVLYAQNPDGSHAYYKEVESKDIHHVSELIFDFSESEEVTIEGRVERGMDGKLRLYTGHINYLYLPSDVNIEGSVIITIKSKPPKEQ